MLIGSLTEEYSMAIDTHDLHNSLHGYSQSILKKKLVKKVLWNKPAYLLSVILEELQRPTDVRLQWLW